MRAAILRHLLYPAWHWAKRDGVNRAVKEAETNQWLPTSELRLMQERKLAKLLVSARDNVPYYSHILSGLRFRPDGIVDKQSLLQIPALTKKIIQNEKDSLISRDLTGNKLTKNSTSGSTGEALRFYTDSRSASKRKAALMRSDSWTGWRLGDRIVRLWGAPMDEKLGAGLRGRLHGWVTGDRFLSSFVLSESKMDEYVRIIRQFQPVLLIAYPGPLEQFAIHCRERRVAFESLKAIVSSAETLWPYQRDIIEKTFNVKIYNRYGSREVSQVASECDAHNGLHISTDRVLVEVVDDDGQSCPKGQTGRILVTDLDNFGMPLIRYEIGDRGTLAEDEDCSCGRGFPKLQAIEGRTMDIVRTPDGRRMGGTFWTLMLKRRPGIRQFQIIQDSLDGIVIDFVRDDEFESEVLEYYVNQIQDYCGRDFGVVFVEKKSIDVTGSGKRRLILSDLPKEAIDKGSKAEAGSC